MRYNASNDWKTNLDSALGDSVEDTLVDVVSSSGCPQVPFKITIDKEIMNVISVDGNTFTVERGAEGTLVTTHDEGNSVENRLTAEVQNALWDDVDDKADFEQTKINHGIQACGALSVSSVGTAHTFKIAGGVTYWYKGAKTVHETDVEIVLGDALLVSPDGVVTQIPNKLYYIFFDGTAGLKAGITMNLKTRVPVAMLYTNNNMTAVALTKETHNHTRDIDWHLNAHRTIGTRYYNGLVLNKPTPSIGNEIEVSIGHIYDEDILHKIQNPLSEGNPVINCRVWYEKSAGVYTWYDSNRPYLTGLGTEQAINNPKFMVPTGGDYTLGNVANNRFINTWVYATNDVNRPIYIVAETRATEIGSVSVALNVPPPTLQGPSVNELAPEFKLIYRLVYRGNGTLEVVTDYRTASGLPAGQVSPTNAGSVSYSPTFDIVEDTQVPRITSTNVQSAVDEVDRKNVPYTGATDDVDLGSKSITAGGFSSGESEGVSVTITLAKLTEEGSNGSLTFLNGILTAYSAPT